MTVATLEDLDRLVERVKSAQAQYEDYTQEQVDRIFRAAARAGFDARLELALAAVQETGMGVLEDKVVKNVIAAEWIYNEYKDTKTCGIIESYPDLGYHKVAAPYGVIAGIVPVTNPTSTAIFKSLLALKTRNGVVLAPHPRSKGATGRTAQLLHDAAVAAGAPEGIIGWIDQPSMELTQALLTHKGVNLILATGGPGLVKAAYSSGKPAIGVGAGNVPVVIDESADIQAAVNCIIVSKTNDNGLPCACEQAVFAVDEVYQRVRDEFTLRGCHILTPAEKAKVDPVVMVDGHLNNAIIGQLPVKIAAMGKVSIPETTRVLIAECERLSPEEAFCREKLSPTLALYRVRDFDDALEKARVYLSYGGQGHSAALHTNQGVHPERIAQFGIKIPVSRVAINQPNVLAVGGGFNVKVAPTFTLGCGSWGGNSVSENVGVKHVMNTKQVVERRERVQCYRVPPRIYFNPDCLPLVLQQELGDKRRAMVVTDLGLHEKGFHTRVTRVLNEMGIDHRVYYEVEPRPTVDTVHRGAEAMQRYEPDLIIALGGGSAIDAAKIMWVLYEHPEVPFEDLALGFTDLSKRIMPFPKLRNKAILVTVPTTSGSGAEVSPGAVIRNAENDMDYIIADYELTPDIAIVDPTLVMNLPKALTASSGMEALSHAIESYVSAGGSDYTGGQALEALRLLFEHLPSAYVKGAQDPLARAKVHYAASLSGLAFSNSYLGLGHGMAHALGVFGVPLGIAQGIFLPHVIRYNAADAPTKQHPLLSYPHAKDRYAEIADYLKLGGRSKDEKVERLIKAVEKLAADCEMAPTIQQLGVPQNVFTENLQSLVMMALGNLAAMGNPRVPMATEVGALFMTAYSGQAPQGPAAEAGDSAASKAPDKAAETK